MTNPVIVDKPIASPKTSIAMYQWVILLLTAGYVALALFMGLFLHYDFLRSDVLGYWQDSLAWQTPFHPFHVPGYPLMIAVLRVITFGAGSPIGLMMGINFVIFLASAFLIHQILKTAGATEHLASLGMLLFALWPFVGLTYTVDPLADLPAMFLFLVGLYWLLKSRRLPAAFLFGLSMITHKAMWLFVGCTVIADLLYRREYFSKQNLMFLAALLFPIGLLWASGSFYHRSMMWLFSSNLEVEVASRSSLPLLDGLVGTFMKGGMSGLSKGLILASLACISGFAVFMSLKLRLEVFPYGLAISLAALALFVVLNQSEIWAAVRFSRLLVIPLALIANNTPMLRNRSWWKTPAVVGILFVLLLSQFVYAWYFATVYFA